MIKEEESNAPVKRDEEEKDGGGGDSTSAEVKGEARRALSPEEADALEDKKYSNQKFSDMYYPQYYEVYKPDPRTFNSKKIVRGPRRCMGCNAMCTEKLRWEPGDRHYCVDCLRRLGVCILPDRQLQLPLEIVLMIALYLEDYRDLCSFARVSWTWFNAVNYDRSAENDLTRVKRFLIGREISVQYERTGHTNKAVTDFVDRFEVGRIIGEWGEANLRRRLTLARHIHDCPFYASALNLQKTSNNPGAYDVAEETLTVGKEIVVYGPKHHGGGLYTVHTKTQNQKPMVLELDPETGAVLACRTGGSAAPSCGKKKCVVM